MERKNPWGVLKAFAKAFGERSDVRLLLKIQGSTRNLDDISLLEAAKKQSNVIILTETLSSEKTAQLMHCLDVYVSLHRAEGFGLTCAEAMAMAKPVIATQYSGNMDFMSANDSILIPAKRYRTEEAFGPYQKGSIWSEPNLEHAAHAMVQLESRDVRNKIGEAASDAIRQRLAPDAVGRIISDQLKRVAKDYADNIRSRAPRRFR
jgi:glycosyltransferase involved in cell wall biosynthesis